MKKMKCQAHQGAFVTGATVIGWNLTTPDGDVLAYTNLRYAITLSRFGAPLVMLGHSVILSRLSRSFSFFCHFLPFAMSFAMSFGKDSDCASASFKWGKSKKSTADPRYTAAPSEVIDGTVRNVPCIQKGGVKGVYGVEAGVRDPMGLR
jgi:hypothetical protein